MAIDIDAKGLRRYWRWDDDQSEGRFLLQAATFETSSPGDAAQLQAVTAQTNRRFVADGGAATAEGWIPTAKGWSGMLYDAPTFNEALRWFELFAEVLGELTDGILTGGPTERMPLPRHSPPQFTPVLSACVAYSTVDLLPVVERNRGVPSNEISTGWFVPEDVTQRLASHAASWAVQGGGNAWFQRNWRWVPGMPSAGLSSALYQSVWRHTASRIQTEMKNDRARIALFTVQGLAMFQSYDPGTPWRRQIDDLRALLLWSPEATDLGFVRNMNYRTTGWDNNSLNPWPFVSEAANPMQRPLLSSYMPDINGLQILTRAHLDRSGDLSDWNVQRVAPDRYLVEAKDLSSWYGSPLPELEALEKARADFDEVILTSVTAMTSPLYHFERG